MPSKKTVYLVISPDADVLGCFSSMAKAKKYQDQWHTNNFVRPFVKDFILE